MFIYSLRAGTLKFFGVVCVALVSLITLIAFIPTYTAGDPGADTDTSAQTVSINYEKIRDNDDRVEFLSQFGWKVEDEPLETVEVIIPTEFDTVFAGYNEIQKAQGLDLAKYKKKTVTRYTYEVTNYPDYKGTVHANVIVYRNRVIGGDICTADMDGFIHGFEKKN
jgi:hypothetical protein